MTRLSIPLLLTIAVALGKEGAGGKILQADFGDAATYQPIPQREFVSGSLPEGWHDEAAWSKAGCSYAFQQEGGTGFLRAICPCDKRLQFFHLIDGFAARKALKLSFRARSKGKSELKFRLQESGKPSSFAAVDIGPGFLESDGTIKKETFFDFVHCTPQAYEVYATKLAAKAKEILEKAK